MNYIIKFYPFHYTQKLKNKNNILFDEILSLPLYTRISKKEQNIVISELESIKNEK